MADEKENSRKNALKMARYLGCTGAHEHDGNWMPCKDHATLVRISNRAEDTGTKLPEEKKVTVKKKRRKRVNDEWEDMGIERGVSSIDSVPGMGIVSGGMKAERFIGRDDPDAFATRRGARIRARQLGCIGIRQYSALGGGTAWMPCTNESDYRRRMGSSQQGRIDTAKRQVAELRKLRRELDRYRRGNKSPASRSKKSMYGSMFMKALPKMDEDRRRQLQGRVTKHNKRMTELGRPSWSRVDLDMLAEVWDRGVSAHKASRSKKTTSTQLANRRVSSFLWMLEHGKPRILTSMSDVRLLPESHPFRKQKKDDAREIVIQVANDLFQR